jgi:Ca2+-binding EF-hand superfamily protein
MTDVQAKANTTVENVSKNLDAAANQNDQTNALEKFQREIEDQLKTMSNDDQKAYMQKIVTDLTANKKLPVLALVFADKIGDLNDEAIKHDIRAESYKIYNNQNGSILTKSMLSYLSENYDSIRYAHDEWGREDRISREDVDAKLKQFRDMRDEEKRVENNQKAATESAKTLLDGGGSSLFACIDQNDDGSLTKDELEHFVRNAERTGSKDGHNAPEKVKFVRDLLASWNDPNGAKWLRGGGEPVYDEYGRVVESDAGIITKHTLLIASGKESEAQLMQADASQPEKKSEKQEQKTEQSVEPTPEKNHSEKNNSSAPAEKNTVDVVTARKNEGYSHLAVRLLGHVKEDASTAEIEKAFAALSAGDKQKVTGLASELANANRNSHRGNLWVGDQIPLKAPAIQAYLKK